MTNLEKDAEEIANAILSGDLQKAQTIWKAATEDLRFFECAALKDKIQKNVREIEEGTDK